MPIKDVAWVQSRALYPPATLNYCLTQPIGEGLPNSDTELLDFHGWLRRMKHIRKRSPGNITGQFAANRRQPPPYFNQGVYADDSGPACVTDTRHTPQYPWAAARVDPWSLLGPVSRLSSAGKNCTTRHNSGPTASRSFRQTTRSPSS